jgi:hypothetical protein
VDAIARLLPDLGPGVFPASMLDLVREHDPIGGASLVEPTPIGVWREGDGYAIRVLFLDE